MPSVTLELSPSGLPIAIAMSPTCELGRVGEDRRLQPGARNLDHRQVVLRERPDERALQDVAGRGRDGEASSSRPTTWSFVTMSPFVSKTIPEPRPLARLDLDDRRRDTRLKTLTNAFWSSDAAEVEAAGAVVAALAGGKARRRPATHNETASNEKRNLESIHAALLPVETEVILRIFRGLLGLPAAATRGRPCARG